MSKSSHIKQLYFILFIIFSFLSYSLSGQIILQANTDSIQIKEEQSIAIYVLQNDSLSNADSLNLSILQNPLHGNAFLQNGTQIRYSPGFNYVGFDSLLYQICDANSLCDSAYVFISITPVNDAPIAIDDVVVGYEEQAVIFYPSQNDIDVDADSLSIQLGMPPKHGNFALGANQALVYLPVNNFVGWDTLSYKSCDSLLLCDEAFVYILVEEVNDAPTILPETFETDMGKAVEVNLLKNEVDEEGNNISLTIINGPNNGSISGDIQSDFVYMPNVNFSGIDSISYRVCDDGYPTACDTGLATIYVRGNIRPMAVNDTLYVTDIELGEISILKNDADLDDDQLFYILNNITNQQTEKGKVFDKGNGIIQYKAKRAYNGMDEFTYTLYDDGGLPQLSDEASIVIIANKTNLPPVAATDSVRLDQAATIQFNILENDSDPENDPLRFQILEYPKGGSLIFNEEGDLTYSGDYYFFGLDELSYELCDSTDNCVTALINITVDEFSIDDLLGAVPNAISPNGDGKNDYFKIRNLESYADNQLLIFNRWGQLIYETTNYKNNWGGENLNKPNVKYTNGTYYYILNITTPANKQKQQRGFIQIIQ